MVCRKSCGMCEKCRLKVFSNHCPPLSTWRLVTVEYALRTLVRRGADRLLRAMSPSETEWRETHRVILFT